MTKRIAAKGKICRRLGVNLWGRPKDPLAGNKPPPGQHGEKRRKQSGYALQLQAKQKLKGYYANMGERQFRRAYEAASNLRGDTAENLVGLLERRLDMVVYRMNFVPTIFAARQFVNHGHVKVNGKRVNIPSYLCKQGDVIELAERARTFPMVMEYAARPERDFPDFVQVDLKSMKGEFVRVPKMADVPYPVVMEPNLVVEYYSR